MCPRYAHLVAAEEGEDLDRMMSSLQQKDECAQKAESVSRLAVAAFHCRTCSIITERKRPECRGHDVRPVTTSKRWWTCDSCGDHASTLGVRMPRTGCRRCRLFPLL